MINNITLPIRKLPEGKLSDGPVELSNDEEIDINQLLADTKRLQPKYRTCELCNEQELKDKMVKCRIFIIGSTHGMTVTLNETDVSIPAFAFESVFSTVKTHQEGLLRDTLLCPEIEADECLEDSENEMYA